MRRAVLEFLVPVLLGIALVVAISASGARALTTPTGSAGPGQYAVAITTVAIAAAAMICVEGAAARYTDDGTTPTASVGIPVTAGQCFAYGGPLSAFRIIGAGATMDVVYYK
jgi:hypothetical protein